MIKKICLIAILAPALGACSATRLYETARDADAADGDYAAALQAGYVRLAHEELREWDHPDSKHFARKALRVAEAGDVDPDELDDRELRDAVQPELSTARYRLSDAKAHVAAQAEPSALANAQIMFDCWLQEQEEGFQEKDIEVCRSGFERAMGGLDGAIALYDARAAEAVRIASASNVSPVPSPQETAPMSLPGPYVIYFGFDDAALSVEARAALDKAVDEIAAGAPTLLVIAGHADRAGGTAYNQKLSKARAEAVAGYLAAKGVSRSSMRIAAHGEERLLVKTADGKREPKNRRVEVSAQPTKVSEASEHVASN